MSLSVYLYLTSYCAEQYIYNECSIQPGGFMVRMTNFLIFLIVLSTSLHAAVHRVPDNFSTIGEAVQAASDGDTIEIAPGTYHEDIILNRSITLAGAGQNECILAGGDKNGTIITVDRNVRIAGLSIGGAENGIFLKAGSKLTIDDCTIRDNKEDGIGFEGSFATVLTMNRCIVTGNVDGIDLESTQGTILNSHFIANRDDGLDYDGDAGVLVYNCTFTENGDDGIEIRLARRTHAIILNCIFQRNGEDGIEIINSPVENGEYNILSIQNSSFMANKRFGVGFVPHKIEQHTGEMCKTAVYAGKNMFLQPVKGHVSPNYRSVFEAARSYPETVNVTVQKGTETESYKVPINIPVLVCVYNLRPTTDGTMFSDAEGVTVFRDRVYAADDNNKMIYALDRRTGSVVNTIPTSPFPGSDKEAPGPEGLDVVNTSGREVLLLADDDGTSLYTLSLDESTYGSILDHQKTTAVGKAEGVENVGDHILFTAGVNKIHRVHAQSLEYEGNIITFDFQNLGRHIAGIGADEAQERVFLTLSDYHANQNYRNQRSGFFEMDGSLEKVISFSHLGPFSNDPRGISASDRLVYVADGRSDFEDINTGEMNRGGIKILVFMLEDNPDELERILPLLPVRSDE